MKERKITFYETKEEKLRNERHELANVLADTVMEGLAFLNGNAALMRYALDKVSQSTILHRVGQRGTRPGSDEEVDLHLEDDLASLLGDIDLDMCLDEMTDLRDTRSRSLGGKKKAKTEDDPLFAEIESVVPTIKELLMSDWAAAWFISIRRQQRNGLSGESTSQAGSSKSANAREKV